MIDSSAILIGMLSFLPIVVLRFSGKFISFVLFAIVVVILHGLYFFGPGILWLLAGMYVISTVAELVSLKTPIYCFGVKYWYNLKHPFFSSKIFLLGVYPLEITFAWVLLKYFSFMVGLLIVSAFSLSVIWEIMLIPFILVSLDFMFDPISVHSSKLWTWERGSAYFGIPWQNFLGWYIVGLLSTSVFILIGHRAPLQFHYLLVLPVLFYGSLLNNSVRLMKLDKRMGIIGSVPAILWTLLGVISLGMLYVR